MISIGHSCPNIPSFSWILFKIIQNRLKTPQTTFFHISMKQNAENHPLKTAFFSTYFGARTVPTRWKSTSFPCLWRCPWPPARCLGVHGPRWCLGGAISIVRPMRKSGKIPWGNRGGKEDDGGENSWENWWENRRNRSISNWGVIFGVIVFEWENHLENFGKWWKMHYKIF